MAKYVVKRVLLAILTIFIVSAITFFSMYAIPGGPFSSEKALSPAVMAALEARYGLDQPVPVQYVNYMWSACPACAAPVPGGLRRQPEDRPRCV